MNHFKVIEDPNGKCDLCGKHVGVYAKLGVDGYATHHIRVCSECLISAGQLMKQAEA